MIEPSPDTFFAYARARETIRRLKESGAPAPWTDDPVLREFRFCNVHREDDKVTRWFAQHVRGPMDRREDENIIFATMLFRFFNTPNVGEILLEHNLFTNWDPHRCCDVLRGVRPIVTGAYMVKTPVGLPKVDGIVACVEDFRAKALDYEVRTWGRSQLRDAWEIIQRGLYLGRFMAYEIVTDLRHTYVLRDASDVMTWANPGPGAGRGLDRVYGDPVETRNRRAVSMADQVQEEMRELLALSQQPCNWPTEWVPWDMRTVEHTLCEFDKYVRAHNGEGRPKQRYRPKE